MIWILYHTSSPPDGYPIPEYLRTRLPGELSTDHNDTLLQMMNLVIRNPTPQLAGK